MSKKHGEIAIVNGSVVVIKPVIVIKSVVVKKSVFVIRSFLNIKSLVVSDSQAFIQRMTINDICNFFDDE